MLIDDFKIQYTSIPFATNCREYKGDVMTSDFTTLPHMHKEMEILSVISGSAKFVSEGKTYDIKEGDIIVIPPFKIHNFIILAGCDFRHICLCFDLDLLYNKALKEKMEKEELVPQNIIRNSECGHYVKEAFIANKEKTAGWELTVVGNLSLFFGALQKNNWIFESAAEQKNHVVREILEFIFENYGENISSSQVARRLHINNSYFCRYFKKTFGCTFHNYLSDYRIEKAKIFLKTTDFSISEISQKTGFESFAYFSRIFKDKMGCTPKQYRNSSR